MYEHLSLSKFAVAFSCVGLLEFSQTLYLLLLKKLDLDQIAFFDDTPFSLVDGVAPPSGARRATAVRAWFSIALTYFD